MSARKRYGVPFKPGRELPPDIKALQDPNFTREDFERALKKIINAPKRKAE